MSLPYENATSGDKARGFEVIPPCDNHDARGFCNGHEKEST